MMGDCQRCGHRFEYGDGDCPRCGWDSDAWRRGGRYGLGRPGTGEWSD